MCIMYTATEPEKDKEREKENLLPSRRTIRMAFIAQVVRSGINTPLGIACKPISLFSIAHPISPTQRRHGSPTC
jgi:hypothetical protein